MAAYRLLACIMLGWRLIVSILPILCYFAPLYARRKLLWSSRRVSNPLFKFFEFAAIVKERVPSAIVIVDNDKPISTKADATNHLSGHHDLMAGVMTCNMILQRWICYVGMWARCYQNWQIAFTINAVGNGLSPIDSLLLLCGIKVLALRMNRQQSTPSLIAKYLHSLRFHVTTLVLMDTQEERSTHRSQTEVVQCWALDWEQIACESIVAGVRPETYSGLKIDKFCNFTLQKDRQRIHYCKVAVKKHEGLW